LGEVFLRPLERHQKLQFGVVNFRMTYASGSQQSVLPPVDPKTAQGKAKEIFEGPLKGKHFNIYRSVANSPAALDGLLKFTGALSHGVLSAKEREVVQLVVGEANNCEYCVAAHTLLGTTSGLTEEQALEARKGNLTGDPKLQALSRFAHALVTKKGFVDPSEVSAFKNAGFTDAHIVEVIAQLSVATFTNYFNHVNKTPLDFPPAPKL